jgi:hypothetical protein
VLIDSVHYYSTLPWDTLANGYGPSLVLCNESLDNDLASSWTTATTPKGSYANFIVKANPMTNCSLVAESGQIEGDQQEILLSPNPGEQIRFIRFYSENSGKSLFTLTDLTGKEIESVPFQRRSGLNSVELSLPSLSAGLYLLQMDGSIPLKLIVQ